MTNDFNSFVSELVYYYLKGCTDMTVEKLAENIGVSSSFVQKCLASPSTGKHFNLWHIYVIANALNVPVSNLMPSKENYQILYNKELSQDDWNWIFENHKSKGERENE